MKKRALWLLLPLVIAGLYGSLFLHYGQAPTVVRQIHVAVPKRLIVTATNADIVVTTTQAKKVLVTESANVAYTPQTIHNGAVTQGRSQVSWVQHFFPTRVQLKVAIPRTYSGRLVIHSASGAVMVRDSHSGAMRISTQSGAISGNLSAKRLQVRAASGAVTLAVAGVSADSTVTTQSGAVDLHLTNLRQVSVDARSASGAVKLSGMSTRRFSEHHWHGGQAESPLLAVQTQSGAIKVR